MIAVVRDILLIVVLLAVIVLGVIFLRAVDETATQWQAPAAPSLPAAPCGGGVC